MINSKIFFLCQFTDYLTDRAGLATKSGRTSVYLQVSQHTKKDDDAE